MQIIETGSWLLPAAIASPILAFRPLNGITMGVALALAVIVVPAGYVLARRIRARVRRQATEARLLTQTKTYFENQVSAHGSEARGQAESDIQILARAIDGRKLPIQDFRKVRPASLLPIGEPVVFGEMPCRRPAERATIMPPPVTRPLTELLPPAADPEER